MAIRSSRLPSLPSLRSTGSDVKRPCQCGCGLTCRNMFRPGHDARLKSGVIAHLRGMSMEAIVATMGAPFGAAVMATFRNADRLRTWDIEVPEGFLPGVAGMEEVG